MFLMINNFRFAIVLGQYTCWRPKLCKYLLIYDYMLSLFFLLFTLHYVFLIIRKDAGRIENYSEKIFSSFPRKSAVNFGTKWGMEHLHAPGSIILSVTQMAKCMETSVPCVPASCECPPHLSHWISSPTIAPESQILHACAEYRPWVIC